MKGSYYSYIRWTSTTIIATYCIFNVLFHPCQSSYDSITSSITLPGECEGSAAGYDDENDIILIFGGQQQKQQFIQFKNNEIIHYDASYLGSTEIVQGSGQNYFQLNNTLWILHRDGTRFVTINTHSPYDVTVPDITIPILVDDDSCLAMTARYIFVIGGTSDGIMAALDHVQIYDMVSDQWSSGPSLPSKRLAVACYIVEDTLYAVGGLIQSQAYDSILTLNVSDAALPDISFQEWQLTAARLNTPAGGSLIIKHRKDLIVIGGAYIPINALFGMTKLNEVNVIDTQTGGCYLAGTLSIATYSTTAILHPVSDTLYIFGGNDARDSLQFINLPTVDPTTGPTNSPSDAPIDSMLFPTNIPSKHPTANPITNATVSPIKDPIFATSNAPTVYVTTHPSQLSISITLNICSAKSIDCDISKDKINDMIIEYVDVQILSTDVVDNKVIISIVATDSTELDKDILTKGIKEALVDEYGDDIDINIEENEDSNEGKHVQNTTNPHYFIAGAGAVVLIVIIVVVVVKRTESKGIIKPNDNGKEEDGDMETRAQTGRGSTVQRVRSLSVESGTKRVRRPTNTMEEGQCKKIRKETEDGLKETCEGEDNDPVPETELYVTAGNHLINAKLVMDGSAFLTAGKPKLKLMRANNKEDSDESDDIWKNTEEGGQTVPSVNDQTTDV